MTTSSVPFGFAIAIAALSVVNNEYQTFTNGTDSVTVCNDGHRQFRGDIEHPGKPPPRPVYEKLPPKFNLRAVH